MNEQLSDSGENLSQALQRLEVEEVEHGICRGKLLSSEESCRIAEEKVEKLSRLTETAISAKDLEIAQLRNALAATVEEGHRRVEELKTENGTYFSGIQIYTFFMFCTFDAASIFLFSLIHAFTHRLLLISVDRSIVWLTDWLTDCI